MNSKTIIAIAAITAASATEAIGLFIDRCARLFGADAPLAHLSCRPCFSQGHGGLFDLSCEVPRALAPWSDGIAEV